MAAPVIGQPGTFDAARESWTQYSKRVAYFFQANGITDRSKQKVTLLAIIGLSAYKLLRSLVAPGEKLHTMEIDTGASVSVISKTIYQHVSYKKAQCT